MSKSFITIGQSDAVSMCLHLNARADNVGKVYDAAWGVLSRYYFTKNIPYFFGLFKKSRADTIDPDRHWNETIWEDFSNKINNDEFTKALKSWRWHGSRFNKALLSFYPKESVSLNETDTIDLRSLRTISTYLDDEKTKKILEFFKSFNYDTGMFETTFPK